MGPAPDSVHPTNHVWVGLEPSAPLRNDARGQETVPPRELLDINVQPLNPTTDEALKR